jgi:hypothetical protein
MNVTGLTSGNGLIKALSKHLPGETEKSRKKPRPRKLDDI